LSTPAVVDTTVGPWRVPVEREQTVCPGRPTDHFVQLEVATGTGLANFNSARLAFVRADGDTTGTAALSGGRVVEDDLRSVKFAPQCTHFCLAGIHGLTKQPHQRTARRTGAVNSGRHTAILVAHSRGDPNVVVEGSEEIKALDPLQMNQTRGVGDANRHSSSSSRSNSSGEGARNGGLERIPF
jgi:hypothetical protein